MNDTNEDSLSRVDVDPFETELFRRFSDTGPSVVPLALCVCREYGSLSKNVRPWRSFIVDGLRSYCKRRSTSFQRSLICYYYWFFGFEWNQPSNVYKTGHTRLLRDFMRQYFVLEVYVCYVIVEPINYETAYSER